MFPRGQERPSGYRRGPHSPETPCFNMRLCISPLHKTRHRRCRKHSKKRGSYEQRRSDIDFYICNMNAACVQQQRTSVMPLPDSCAVHRTRLRLFTRAIKDHAAAGLPWQQTNKFNPNPTSVMPAPSQGRSGALLLLTLRLTESPRSR